MRTDIDIDDELLEKAMRLAQLADFRAAAGLYRDACQRGVTVRSTIDCLMAAVHIRTDYRLLRSDKDFERLARLSQLSLVDLV